MSHSRFSRRQMIQAGAATLGAASWGSLMAQPSAATTAALAALTGAERLKRLAEGAKKEGVVSIYTSMPQDDMAALTSAFEAKYGVKAKVWRSVVCLKPKPTDLKWTCLKPTAQRWKSCRAKKS